MHNNCKICTTLRRFCFARLDFYTIVLSRVLLLYQHSSPFIYPVKLDRHVSFYTTALLTVQQSENSVSIR